MLKSVPPLTTNTRVYIIEPQPLMTRAICGALSDAADMTIVGTATALDPDRFALSRPSIVLVDCDGNPQMLPNVVAACRRAVSRVNVCILSAGLGIETMMQALSAGANGYILKDITPATFVNAIRTVESQGFYADPRLSAVLLRRHANRETTELSPRELEVVRLIAQGLSNKEISFRLSLSDKTVKNHIANIFTKLHMNARTQVAIYAIRNGMA